MAGSRQGVTLIVEGRVAQLVLERPPVNAFDQNLLQCLDTSLDRLAAEQNVSVLHIRSGLRVFSAGADLDLMRELLATPEGRDSMIGVVRSMQRVFKRIEDLRVVTVAEIGGAAMGGGLELALACDLRIASERAKLGLPEAGLGLLPGAGGTQRLPKICGDAVARRLILGAEVIDGGEAERLGLVHWAATAEMLESRVAELITRLGSVPAEAVAACKACIAAAADDSIDGYELELAETRRLHDVEETARRIEAFLRRQA